MSVNDLKMRTIAKKFLRSIHEMDHHVAPFNILLDTWLKNIVYNICHFDVTFDVGGDAKRIKVECLNMRLDNKETTLPQQCFRMNTTYAVKVLVDFRVHINDVVSEYNSVCLCYFPIMTYSNMCGLTGDRAHSTIPPGTFIMRGKMRYIPLCGTLVINIPFRLKTREGDHVIHIRSRHRNKLHRSTSTLEIRCNHVKTRSFLYYNIMLKIPFLAPMVPLGIVVVAMGKCLVDFAMELRAELGHHPRFEQYMCAMLEVGSAFDTEGAQNHLINLYGNPVDIKKQLTQDVLPHVGKSWSKKLDHMVLYVSELLRFREGLLEPSDRDNYKYIRIQTGAELLAGLFRVQLQKHVQLAIKMIRKQILSKVALNFVNAFSHIRFTRAIFSAMSTGAFTKKRLGVSQQLNTLNVYAKMSQLRRVSSSSLNSDGQRRKPRQVHPSQWGLLCAAETPEGEQCGLVQVLALLATVSSAALSGADTAVLRSGLGTILFESPPLSRDTIYTIIDSEGCIAGYTTVPSQLYSLFMNAVSKNQISTCTTLCVENDTKRIWIQCDRGRLIRPVAVKSRIISTQIDTNISKQDIFKKGLAVYISSDSFKPISTRWDDEAADLTELSPISFLGVNAALSPMFRHNQGPRLVYWISMMKQIIVADQNSHTGEATTHRLHYGQSPLVITRASKMIGLDKQRDGANVVIAFYPHPYNQEDAIVVNRASVEKGLFVTSSLRRHKHELSTSGSNMKFTNPHLSNADGLSDTSYHHLNVDGLPIVGTYLQKNDILIGKSQSVKRGFQKISTRKKDRDRHAKPVAADKDCSIRLRGNEEGEVLASSIVESVGKQVAMVDVLNRLEPQVGDKLSSRHSQKGTIGYLEQPENLPFNQYGMSPDIIVSPLGLTSRMTIGKILECIMGKAVAVTGQRELGIDEQNLSVPFDGALECIQDTLKEHGFKKDGTELFTDGRTGEVIKASILSGTVFYTKLNHMINKKFHARASGPINPLTKQPVEGRKNNGGLRFGQMESECLQAHATTHIMRERFSTASDEFEIPLCCLCGRIAICNDKLDYSFCKLCRQQNTAKRIKIGYATKLMVQELQATGVDVVLPITNTN